MQEEPVGLETKLIEVSQKLDLIYASQEKMRKFFLWSLIIAIGVIVLPLLLMPLVLPAFLNSVALPVGF